MDPSELEHHQNDWILCCSNQLELLDVLKAQVHTISLPIKLKCVFLVSEDRWLLLESTTNK